MKEIKMITLNNGITYFKKNNHYYKTTGWLIRDSNYKEFQQALKEMEKQL